MSATMTNGRFEHKASPAQPGAFALGRVLLDEARNVGAPSETLVTALEKLPDGLPMPLRDAMVLVIDQLRRNPQIDGAFADRLRQVLTSFGSDRLDPEETLKQMDAFVAEVENPERDDPLRLAIAIHRILRTPLAIDDSLRLVILAAEQQDPRALAAIDLIADGQPEDAERAEALLRDGDLIRPQWIAGAEASEVVREIFKRLQEAVKTPARAWWQKTWAIVSLASVCLYLYLAVIVACGYALGRSTAPTPPTPEPVIIRESPPAKTALAFNDDLGNPAYIVPIVTVSLPDHATVELEAKLTALLTKRRTDAKLGEPATRILHYRDLPIARSIPAETFAAARSRPLLTMVVASAPPKDSWPLTDTTRAQVCIIIVRLATAADNSSTLQLHAEAMRFAFPEDSVLRLGKPIAIGTSATSGVIELSNPVTTRPGVGSAYDRLARVSLFSDDVNGVIAAEAAHALNPDDVNAMQLAAATHLLSTLDKAPHFSLSGVEVTPRERARHLLRMAYVTGHARYDAIRLRAALEGESARQQYLVRETWLSFDAEYVAHLKMTDDKQKAEVRAWAARLRKAVAP